VGADTGAGVAAMAAVGAGAVAMAVAVDAAVIAVTAATAGKPSKFLGSGAKPGRCRFLSP
jgi:hypothetical protein